MMTDGLGARAELTTTAAPQSPIGNLENAITQLRDVVETNHSVVCRVHETMYGGYSFSPNLADAKAVEDSPGRIAELERMIHGAREMIQLSLAVAESLETNA